MGLALITGNWLLVIDEFKLQVSHHKIKPQFYKLASLLPSSQSRPRATSNGRPATSRKKPLTFSGRMLIFKG
jgi:hypothetical protein